MRIALYARKSTESEDRQVQSLEDQFRALTALAEREHLHIVEVLQESKSAKAPDTRPEFLKLLKFIDEGQIDGILTWSINRLSRNPVDGGRLAYLLQTGKISMIRTIERTYLPSDNALLMSIENGMATAYLQDLSRNVKRGMQGKVDRGWHACKAPVGYLNNPITREIDPDPERFDLMQSAWTELLAGDATISKIWRRLASAGLTVPSRYGEQRVISRAGLYNIFKNRFYTGEVLLKGTRYPGKHRSMVTPFEFSWAQELIKQNGDTRAKFEQAFPFNRVIRCATCGCAVIGERKRKFYPSTGRFAEYIYYHCSGSKGCSKRGIRQEEITEQLERLCSTVEIKRPLGEWLKSALAESLEKSGFQQESNSAQLAVRLAKLEERRKRLMFMRLDHEISEPDYQEFMDRLNQDRSTLEAEQQRLSEARSRIIHHGHQLIDAAIAASELPNGGSYLSVLGGIVRRMGTHTLCGTEIRLTPDSALRKIAMFEPAEADSRRPKHGDSVPSNSSWWNLVDEVLTLLVEADMQPATPRMHHVHK